MFAPLLLESRFLNFEASRFFFILGFRLWGSWILWALCCLDPALKQGTKISFGAPLFRAAIFKFWGLNFYVF